MRASPMEAEFPQPSACGTDKHRQSANRAGSGREGVRVRQGCCKAICCLAVFVIRFLGFFDSSRGRCQERWSRWLEVSEWAIGWGGSCIEVCSVVYSNDLFLSTSPPTPREEQKNIQKITQNEIQSWRNCCQSLKAVCASVSRYPI